MKNVVRILSLTGALALAAIPAAPFETTGPCQFRCCSTEPRQCESHTLTTTQYECCSGTELYCPPGTTLRGVTWGVPPEKCSF